MLINVNSSVEKRLVIPTDLNIEVSVICNIDGRNSLLFSTTARYKDVPGRISNVVIWPYFIRCRVFCTVLRVMRGVTWVYAGNS